MSYNSLRVDYRHDLIRIVLRASGVHYWLVVFIEQFQELFQIRPFVYVYESFFRAVFYDSISFDVGLVLEASVVTGNEGMTQCFVLGRKYEVQHHCETTLVSA